MKGKYIRTWRDDYNKTIVHEYEYRGHRYEVIDAGWKGGQQPIPDQHRAEQDHIDELIEKEKKWSSYKGEDAEIGFNLFMEYYGE